MAQVLGDTTAQGNGSAIAFVPLVYFGSQANQLGIVPTSHGVARRLLCNMPIGAITSPMINGNPYDQLAELRANGLEGCAVREEGWQLTGTLRLKCSNRFSVRLAMLLSVQSFRIRKLYGMPIVTVRERSDR